MSDPSIRKRHLAGLKKAKQKHGSNFKRGNGKPPAKIARRMIKLLSRVGFITEYVIPTRGHETEYKVPTSYKVDLGHPKKRIAIELDGPCHRKLAAKAKDIKKAAVLKSLGWKVVRLSHE